jgi:MIP family channel proteins
VDTNEYIRRGVAEFIGAFALIFIGAGATIYAVNGSFDPMVAAFANGLVIAVMVSSFAHVSGGHFNPAVTLGFFVTRRIPALMAVFYWVVQFGAAALAALLLKWVLPGQVKAGHYGAPAVNSLITSGKAVTVEAVCTFFLVTVVFATAVDAKGAFDKIAGLAIGLTITFGALMAGGLTGGAFNPARAFGPELVSNHWSKAWVYYVGPFAGGALAAIVYELVYLGRPRHEDIGAPSELYTPEDLADAVKDPDTDVVVMVDEPELDEPGSGEPPTDARL